MDRRPLNRPTRDNHNKPTTRQMRHSDTILPNSPPLVDGDDDPTDVNKPSAKERKKVAPYDDYYDSGMSSASSLDSNSTNNSINNRNFSNNNNVNYQQQRQQYPLEGVDEEEYDAYEAKGNSNRASDGELERSYDFAKDEERREKLRRMKKEKEREEEEKKRRKMERERNTYRQESSFCRLLLLQYHHLY